MLEKNEIILIEKLKNYSRKITHFEQIKKVIDTLFYIEIKSKNQFGFEYIIDAFGKIILLEEFKHKKLISNEEEIGLYIYENYLLNAESPYEFEREFVFHLLNDVQHKSGLIWGIEINILIELLFTYYDKYLTSQTETNWIIYQHFHRAFEKCDKIKVKQRFKYFINADNCKTFINQIVQKQPFENCYNLSSLIPKVYDSFDNFLSFIDTLNQDDFMIEFKEFYQNLKLFNFKERKYIVFEFKQIKPVNIKEVNSRDQELLQIILRFENTDLYEAIKTNTEFRQETQSLLIDYDFAPDFKGYMNIVGIANASLNLKIEIAKLIASIHAFTIKSTEPDKQNEILNTRNFPKESALITIGDIPIVSLISIQPKNLLDKY